MLSSTTDLMTVSSAAGTVVELDTAQFNARIAGHALAVVDFWAPWCAPWRAFAPTFAAAALRHPDVLFAKVNTEAEQELAVHFGIRSIPTLMVFRDDIIVYAEAGALPASGLEQVIAAAKSLDMDEVRREIAAQSSLGAPAGAAG